LSGERPWIEHLITGLDTGGAELMLHKLLANGSDRFRHSVTSLTGRGQLAGTIEAAGIPVRALNMKKDVRAFAGVLELARTWRVSPPALVQTWMYHADLVGALAGWWSDVPVVWNIRQSRVDPGVNKLRTSAFAWLCAGLSGRVPEKIVCCSATAAAEHRDMGYCEAKITVIPNGFDMDAFQPDRATRARMRRELAVRDDEVLMGRIGRFHPQKDYGGFIRAAVAVLDKAPRTRFVMIGEGLDWSNAALVEMLRKHGIEERCLLLGRRADVADVIRALDVTVSSSSCGEGFPNVVAESMACAVPCVVTDVGDSAAIVGDAERVVPPGRPDLLAEACLAVVAMDPAGRRQLGENARQRLARLYNLPDVIRRYESLYSEVLTNVRHRRPH